MITKLLDSVFNLWPEPDQLRGDPVEHMSLPTQCTTCPDGWAVQIYVILFLYYGWGNQRIPLWCLTNSVGLFQFLMYHNGFLGFLYIFLAIPVVNVADAGDGWGAQFIQLLCSFFECLNFLLNPACFQIVTPVNIQEGCKSIRCRLNGCVEQEES